jgi:hypothetical protein
MKKLLLPLAATLAALSASAITETPVMTYDYSTATETGLTTDYYASKANPDSPIWETVNGDERYNNGMLFIASPNIQDGTFATLKQGISIQKIGGEVGNVLCINGATKSFNEATGFEAPEISFNPFWNLNWLTDPKNTPVGGSAEEPMIRVRITFNVYNSSTSHVNIPNAAYLVSNLGATGTNDNTATIGALSTSNFVDADGNWDSTKWCEYEFDTFCAKEENSTPARLKFEFNNWANGITGRTLLIQKVEFFQISDYTADEINVGTRKVTYKTMKVNFGGEKEVADDDPTSSVANIAVENNESVEYFNLQGVRVANPANGIFIRRQGGHASKVIFK